MPMRQPTIAAGRCRAGRRGGRRRRPGAGVGGRRSACPRPSRAGRTRRPAGRRTRRRAAIRPSRRGGVDRRPWRGGRPRRRRRADDDGRRRPARRTCHLSEAGGGVGQVVERERRHSPAERTVGDAGARSPRPTTAPRLAAPARPAGAQHRGGEVERDDPGAGGEQREGRRAGAGAHVERPSGRPAPRGLAGPAPRPVGRRPAPARRDQALPVASYARPTAVDERPGRCVAARRRSQPSGARPGRGRPTSRARRRRRAPSPSRTAPGCRAGRGRAGVPPAVGVDTPGARGRARNRSIGDLLRLGQPGPVERQVPPEVVGGGPVAGVGAVEQDRAAVGVAAEVAHLPVAVQQRPRRGRPAPRRATHGARRRAATTSRTSAGARSANARQPSVGDRPGPRRGQPRPRLAGRACRGRRTTSGWWGRAGRPRPASPRSGPTARPGGRRTPTCWSAGTTSSPSGTRWAPTSRISSAAPQPFRPNPRAAPTTVWSIVGGKAS